MVFAADRTVDDVEVRASADQIEKAYHEAGYHFAKVAGTLSGDASERVVRFEIDEGPRVAVESIVFEGARRSPPSSWPSRCRRGRRG